MRFLLCSVSFGVFSSISLSLSLPQVAAAASPVLNIPEGDFISRGFSESHGDSMVGWVFTLNQATTVTQIGWYDEGKDGLSRDFRVGLWKNTTNDYFAPGSTSVELLGTAGDGIVIPGGTGTTLNGVYRVVDLASPLLLEPGIYQIGGLDTASTTDPLHYFVYWDVASTPVLSPYSFFYGGTAGNPPVTTLQPTNSNQFYLATGYEIGPMFFTVPEPSGLLLGCLSAGLFFGRRKR